MSYFAVGTTTYECPQKIRPGKKSPQKKFAMKKNRLTFVCGCVIMTLYQDGNPRRFGMIL